MYIIEENVFLNDKPKPAKVQCLTHLMALVITFNKKITHTPVIRIAYIKCFSGFVRIITWMYFVVFEKFVLFLLYICHTVCFKWKSRAEGETKWRLGETELFTLSLFPFYLFFSWFFGACCASHYSNGHFLTANTWSKW